MTHFAGVLRDQRANSRLQTCLSCEVRMGDAASRAFLLDASLTGALISSSLQPPKGAPISISVEIPALKKTLLLEGKVVRCIPGMFDQEPLCHIGVRFSRITPDSIILVKALTDKTEAGIVARNEKDTNQ